MRLSVCIVTYNNAATIADCLRATQRACEGLTAEIIVVDNASADGTADVVRRHSPAVRFIAEPVNHGFGAACNIGLGRATGEYVLFLNPDTVPAPDSIPVMLQYLLERRDVGLVGCRMVGEHGKVRHSWYGFPSFRSALHDECAFLRWFGAFRKENARCQMDGFDGTWTNCVDWVAGAVMLVRREVVTSIGGFDERFFMYAEDADLCHSIRDAGLKVVYCSEAKVLHIGGHSSGQSFKSFARMRCERMCSLMKFFAKHTGRNRTRAFKCIFLPLVAFQNAMSAPRDALHAVGDLVLGKRDKSVRRFRRAFVALSFLLGRWVKVALA